MEMIFGLTLQPLFSQSVNSIAIESSNMSGFSVKTDSEWRRAATRDPKAIDDGLQSCITDTRVTRAISSDVAFGARCGGSIATTTKVVPASYISWWRALISLFCHCAATPLLLLLLQSRAQPLSLPWFKTQGRCLVIFTEKFHDCTCKIRQSQRGD